MKVLFIGDIFGKPGRMILQQHIDGLKRKHGIDVTIANGENIAGGFGITPDLADDLLAMGVDMITSGNHIWSKHEIKDYLARSKKLLRPHNMYASAPGSGLGYVEERLNKPLAVINLIGRVFIANHECPFKCASALLEKVRQRTNLIIVDMHAEATSEKRALGWYLDGSVSAVLGTHTHVQTADEEVLPGGTAYITDVGMTGPHDSVIGVEKAEIIEKFITQIPLRFSAATSGAQINGVVLDLDEASGRCRTIERIRVKE